jgi:glycosyltransferase 2 family protein
MLKLVRLLLLSAGLALSGYLIHEHAAGIAEALGRVSWGILPFLAASALVYALDAWAWRLAFVKGQAPVGFFRLFSVRMAGEAVNKVTPLASLGGEPLKGYLLTRSGSSLGDALASVAIAKNVMTIAQIAFIFCGIGVAFHVLPERQALLLGFGVFPGIILSAMIVTAIVDLRLRRMRATGPPGAAPSPSEARPSRGKAMLELWSQVADYFWARPGAFGLSLLLFFLGWAAGALELLAGSHALGMPLGVRDALVLEALICSANMATFFIPANAGAQEGGFTYLAPMLGLSGPHGIALAILRRLRDVVWIVFGLAYLSLTEGRVLFRPDPVPDEPPGRHGGQEDEGRGTDRMREHHPA